MITCKFGYSFDTGFVLFNCTTPVPATVSEPPFCVGGGFENEEVLKVKAKFARMTSEA